ncbi:MAG: choice-of-anchor Q domain-containing protein [Pseudomonas sp.]|uniref:choice-of-anchor Q domain-containing protein n=1 Tax=Pseudomonas sp. TaxID=306 RepID=UPI0033935215
MPMPTIGGHSVAQRVVPLLLTGVLAGGSLNALAADFSVSTGEDQFDGICNSHCSLRDAVAAANALPGADRILLGAGSYTLSLPADVGGEGESLDEDANLNGDLDIDDELSIVGLGAEQSFVRSTPAARDRVFEVLGNGRLLLQRLAVENGRTWFYGGGLENHGQVRLDRVHFNFNRASGAFEPGNGGGIANYGSLMVDSSRFQNNSSSAGEGSFGHGGAILNRGSLTVRDSNFSGNSASDDDDAALGGAIANQGQADITRSVFVGNRVPTNGSGAAISNDKGGVLKLTNSTLSGNFGPGSVSNGQYYPPGGGIPRAQLINVSIVGNTGYGLNNFGKLSLRNSLIIGNHDEYEEEALNCNNIGPQASYQASGLLLGNGPGNCTAELYRENSQTFTQVLYPLADNNNPALPTHALRAGSPALDAGLGSCTQHDQRGASRPRDGDGDGVAVCDLGAYERPKP